LRHPESGAPLSFRAAQKDERLKKWAETAYRSTIRTQACDILRGYLPAATLTNVGFFGVGQAFEYLLTKLYSSELSEMKALAGSMHRELNELIPSFVKRAKRSDYLADSFAATRAAAERLAGKKPATAAEPVTLVSYDERGEEKIL